MLRTIEKGQSISTRSFGGLCPYYYIDKDTGRVLLADTAAEIISAIPPEQRVIDPVACLSLFCFSYPLGDRTLIRGVWRMPWHSTLNGEGNLERQAPLPHGDRLADTETIADSLLSCLEEELSDYLQGHKRAWILLSGGLDSRITAAIVKRIQKDFFSTEIHAATWGSEKSRDVVYASRIAEKFGWQWHYIPYNEETLWENIGYAAEWGGAEVAGVHLHAMRALGKILEPSDVVIASSWGDSIGRAEFSGQHLTNLSLKPVQNRYLLIHRSIASLCISEAENDRQLAWSTEPASLKHIVAELDAQENYMRRMIGHAMNYLACFSRLEQSFTASRTVRTMWSYAPICRQTEVYFRLLKKLDPFLYELPWARNGIAPSGASEEDPTLTISYHEWGRWLREGRREELKELVCNSGLAELGIFNMSQVCKCFDHWLEQPLDSIGRTEAILQLAGIEILRRRYGLVSSGDCTDFIDKMISLGYSAAKKVHGRVPLSFLIH